MLISREEFLQGPPVACATAPGRVNLLGEHTDYNDGFVLPTAMPQRTSVAIAPSTDQHFHLYSSTLEQHVHFTSDTHAPAGFGRYIEGCIRVLEQRAMMVPPLRIYVVSDVPVGAGLSSSAALELATLRGLRSWLGFQLDDVALALIGQEAEVQYAQVNCGIMDQMAASLADSGHMLFLDTRTLAYRLLPMPEKTSLLVIDSGVSRTLAGSTYNIRRAECEQAATLLGVQSLRDVSDPSLVENLPEPYRRRARHVVLENNRVLTACNGVSAACFGNLMNQSHASLRDDYEVSIAELDELTMLLRSHSGVYGARLTGAGFGGACVALCHQGEAKAIGQAALTRYNQAGRRHGSLLLAS